MTSTPITPLDPRRRRLLMALSGGAMLASPIALLGCGGGNGAAATAAEPGRLHDAGRAFTGGNALQSVNVVVSVPAGVVLPAGELAVHTLTGGFAPVDGNTAAVRIPSMAPQWATVFDPRGLPLLFGYVGTGRTELSAHSTATALMSLGLGAEWLEGGASAAWIAEIEAHPACAALADALAGALAADPLALVGTGDAVVAALRDAVAAMLPQQALQATRRGAQGLVVAPSASASGLEVVNAATLNTGYLQNERLRRAWFIVRRESSSDGTTTTPDPLRTEIVSGDVPMPAGLASASDIVGSVTEAVYGDTVTSLAFGRTDPFELPVTPDTAKRTTYSVTVLTAGNAALGYDEAAYATLSETERRKIDIGAFAEENLSLQQLVLDMLLPLFLNWVAGKVSGDADGMSPREIKARAKAALFGESLTLLSTTIPSVVQKIKTDPKYDSGAAAVDILTNHLVVFVDVPVPGQAQPVTVPTLTPFSLGMIELLLKFLAYEVLKADTGDLLLRFLEGDENTAGVKLWSWQGKDPAKSSLVLKSENLRYAGVGVAMKCLGLVNAGLDAFNKARMLTDISTSRLLEQWQVVATKAKVALRPDPFEVDATGVTYAIKADIVDNDNDEYGIEKGSFDFDWECSGHYGDLYSPADGALANPNRFTTSKNNATANYLPKHPEPEQTVPETITVKAYFQPIGSSQPRQYLGTASTTVKFKKAFSLAISPGGPLNLPTGITMPLTAFVKETLPSGATVEWTWTHGGVGTLTADPVDGDPRASSARLATGDADGSVRVQVTARVNVPGTTIAVVTDPVEAVYTVKKGTRELTFVAPGGVFPCGKGCGVTDYTAFIVPRIPGALGYRAVFTEFGYGPCNRSVSWNAPVGDGGGCNFPITYHPIQAGASASFWAVWIGFGGPLTGPGTCTVTITLPA